MEGLGGRIIAAGAIAVTSCSLLLLSYLRHKSPAKCEPEATIAIEEVSLPNSGVKSQCSYSENSKSKVGKKVRFSEDVKDPSKNNEEYRKRRGRNRLEYQYSLGDSLTVCKAVLLKKYKVGDCATPTNLDCLPSVHELLVKYYWVGDQG
ncbi:hypothetical protein NMG60_11026850 [Bertholletia excelsa]